LPLSVKRVDVSVAKGCLYSHYNPPAIPTTNIRSSHTSISHISSALSNIDLSNPPVFLSTVIKPINYSMTVKKSKFLVFVVPCQSIDEAMRIFTNMKDDKASHNCWAFRCSNPMLERCSDDGEPGGSAGRPILSAIASEGLVDVFVLVTRHFGGIKLGTGGLARAYGGAAREALRLSERGQLIGAVTRLRVTVPVSCVGALYQCLQDISDKISDRTEGGYSQIDEGAFSPVLGGEGASPNIEGGGYVGRDIHLIDVYSIDVVLSKYIVEELSNSLKDSCRGRAIVTIIDPD
jgi:putative IMPACT (imprinted ancient) family translation regulator